MGAAVLIGLVAVGVVLAVLAGRGYLAPAAREAGALISDVQGWRARLSADDSKDKEAAKGEREGQEGE